MQHFIDSYAEVQLVTHDSLQANSVAKCQLSEDVDVWETPVRVPGSKHRTTNKSTRLHPKFLYFNAEELTHIFRSSASSSSLQLGVMVPLIAYTCNAQLSKTRSCCTPHLIIKLGF